jgi:leucyl-tRNA synthetase
MALHDMGYIDFDEPFKKFRAHGLIIKDGAKMSKSRGNVVNPDEFIEEYGADCFRTYLMFLGPYTQGGDFQDKGITGVRRFYDRLYRAVLSRSYTASPVDDQELVTLTHRTVRDVTQHMKTLEYNTAIAFMMEYLNGITRRDVIHRETLEVLVRLVAPFGPHLAEELWEMLGHKDSVFTAGWPQWDESKIVIDTFELVAQVNGKVRATMKAPVDITREDAISKAAANENVHRFIDGKSVIKTVYVPGKLVNIVVK